ncbi:hypothetical protein D3C76_1780730 [compost metagenome]
MDAFALAVPTAAIGAVTIRDRLCPALLICCPIDSIFLAAASRALEAFSHAVVCLFISVVVV